MAAGSFHNLKQDSPLAGEANPASAELALEAARGFVDVDAFAGRDAMDGSGGHGLQNGIIAEGPKCGGSEEAQPQTQNMTTEGTEKTGEHRERKNGCRATTSGGRGAAWAH
jgi:hypothetical protein